MRNFAVQSRVMHTHQEIADLRRDYKLKALNEADVAKDPFAQFGYWWHDVMDSKIDEPNAMTVATANAQGIPAARICLLKGYDTNGFVFFTNYNSHKGQDLAANPHASLVFFWKELERQVCIEGRVEKLSDADNDAYFFSRPAGSRIGAWSSPQSQVIASRNIIEQNYLQYEAQYGTENIPRPPHWGGFVVKPHTIEFWQGRSSRMHDRIRYTLQADGSWKIERLAP